jgi:hypothetical protein
VRGRWQWRKIVGDGDSSGSRVAAGVVTKTRSNSSAAFYQMARASLPNGAFGLRPDLADSHHHQHNMVDVGLEYSSRKERMQVQFPIRHNAVQTYRLPGPYQLGARLRWDADGLSNL